MRFNGQQYDDQYRELLATAAEEPNCPTESSAALADFLQNVASKAGLAGKLNECGLERDRLPQLAQDAAQQWTASFNPIPVSQAELLRLYEQAF